MPDARTKLLEHFDEEVHENLRLRQDKTQHQIDRFQQCLWSVTGIELADAAEFDDEHYAFRLMRLPDWVSSHEVPLHQYRLVTQRADSTEHQYRFGQGKSIDGERKRA